MGNVYSSRRGAYLHERKGAASFSGKDIQQTHPDTKDSTLEMFCKMESLRNSIEIKTAKRGFRCAKREWVTRSMPLS